MQERPSWLPPDRMPARVDPSRRVQRPARQPEDRPRPILPVDSELVLPAREFPVRHRAQIDVSLLPGTRRMPYWTAYPGQRCEDPVPPALRLWVLERDKWICAYCSGDLRLLPVKECEVDHIIPRADGGPALDPTNLAAACWWCNRGPDGKHRQTPEEWRRRRLKAHLCWPPPVFGGTGLARR